MSFDWIQESPAHWDAGKVAIVGGAPAGAFPPKSYREGELLPGDWWRVEENGRVLGYGWMDCTWGEAEILLAVDPGSQKRGIGSFILGRLEREAAARGIEYMQNVVRRGHPDRARVTAWLRGHGFEPARDDDRLDRRVRPAPPP